MNHLLVFERKGAIIMLRHWFYICSVAIILCVSQKSYAQAIIREDFVSESVAAQFDNNPGYLVHGKIHYEQTTVNTTVKAIIQTDINTGEDISYITLMTNGDIGGYIGSSYIDYDELDSLIRALEYIEAFVNIRPGDRKKEFVFFRTRDGLLLDVHTATLGNDVMIEHTKYVSPVLTKLTGINELTNLISHLKEAKAVLDNLH